MSLPIRFLRALALAAALMALAAAPGESQDVTPRSVSIPFELDHNRMIVAVQFVRPDGTVRNARAWVDSGNPTLMLTEALAHDIGLEITQTPTMLLGDFQPDLARVRVRVLPGERVLPGVPAEANVPSTVLHQRHVVFDYPRRTLTMSRTAPAAPRGIAVPCRVNRETGIVQVDAAIGGDPMQLAIDNGSSSTWVSDAVTRALRLRSPGAPSVTGAVAAANFFGFPFESGAELMRSDIRLGGVSARPLIIAGMPQSFIDWYSKKTAAPVSGFVGADFLQGFRIEIDYGKETSYWEAAPRPRSSAFDVVGLTLSPESDGTFNIAAVATRDGRPAVEGVRAGDRLVRVGRLDVKGRTMGTVWRALSGKPGEKKLLTVERDGMRVDVRAVVMQFP